MAPSALLDAPTALPERELTLARYALADALRLERELGIGHVLSQVLVRRGLGDPAAARAFLAADERHAPGGFAGIDEALEVVRGAIAAGTRITVHGDYDVDGVCATAIMVRALRGLGACVDWFIPGRLQDGYGLSEATVRRLAARGTGLILTVDCAITAVEEVALARAAGMAVLVTDHHAPRADGRLPDCPVVHPAVCGYPCSELCGAAVAHKLALALGAPSAGDDAELVALATVADLVPLVGENRRLVREGLRALAITARPGLRALMAVAKIDPGALDAATLGFRLAPRINAAGRLTRADAALELLLCEDPARAQQIAAELDAVNAERRALEQRILWEAEAQIRERAEREDGRTPSAYVLVGEGWHPGVVGIVASRIVEAHHRPAVLIGVDSRTGSGVGSARSIPGFDLLGALHAAAAHLGRYGGHRMAAGLSLELGRVDDFRASFEAHAGEMLTPELLARAERADAVVSGGELGLALAEELDGLEPCGIGNPAPRLLIPGGRFADVRPMGEGRHARFAVMCGGVRAKAVAFGCEGRVAADLDAPHDATFRLERSVWHGAVEPRLVLRHATPCAPAPITRLGPERDYLTAVLAELERDPTDAPVGPVMAAIANRGPGRTVLDRRGESPLAVLADAVASAEAVLAVCADVPRRLEGLRSRAGGFTLASYAELAGRSVTAGFDQIVALDPPSGRAEHAILTGGAGVAHLAWGAAELRFAQQVHEREYGLRPSLIALYRALRARGQAAGEELARLLRGEGPHGRSPSLAARLVRVLVELELARLDRDGPSLAIAGAPAPTTLERSPSYRVYAERHEDGKRFLSSANHPRGA